MFPTDSARTRLRIGAAELSARRDTYHIFSNGPKLVD